MKTTIRGSKTEVRPAKERITAGKYFLLSILFLTFLTSTIYSQFTWQRTYHPINEGDEEAFDICPADSNSYYIAGISAPGFRRQYVIKIGQQGDTIWTRVYGFGEIYTVAPVIDGGCIFAGYAGGAFACRIKLNGDTLWYRTYNTLNFQDIKKGADNTYFLCGANFSNDRYNGYVCNIDIAGNILWEKIYNANFTLDVIRLEFAMDGGLIMGGKKRDFAGGPENAYLAKINDTGGIVWESMYTLGISDLVTGIQPTGNGYILTGYANDKLFVMRTNLNGDSVRANIFNTTNYIGISTILKANDNKFYVSHVNGITGSESRVYSIDTNITVINFLSLQNDEGLSILSMTKAVNSPNSDIILVGITAFEPANEDAYAVRLDSALNPPPPISVNTISSETPIDFELLQNYPNPFNGTTIIKFSIKKKTLVQLKIFDVLGREVEILVSETLRPGVYSKAFSSNTLSSGVYFYQLKVDNKIISTHKMILVK